MQCPSCDTTLDQDFGMVTCSNCKAVLMIDISGQVQMGSENTPTPGEESLVEATNETVFENSGIYGQTETATDPIDPDETVPELPASDEEDIASTSEDNFTNSGQGFDPIEADIDNLLEDVEEILSSDGDMVATSFEEDEDIEEFEDGEERHKDPVVEQPVARFEEPEEEQDFSMPQEPDPNPVDVTSFANSEASNLEDGEYLYDVMVGRIDSKDLKEALKYVLIDEKLKLNHHEFLKKIKDGKVTIPDLNPIKAKRIVEQLQYFDLDIKWLQKRVIMETVEPDDSEADEINEDAIV